MGRASFKIPSNALLLNQIHNPLFLLSAKGKAQPESYSRSVERHKVNLKMWHSSWYMIFLALLQHALP